jgi:hypothetical protein
MFTIDFYTIPTRYTDYQLFFRRRDQKKFRPAIARNPSTALGLLLYMNREHISKPGSELRTLLDTTAMLGIPGLTLVGDGIWSGEEWAARLLPESSWCFPEKFLKRDVSPSEERVTIETLIAASERRKDEGRQEHKKAEREWKRIVKFLGD